MQTTYKKVYDPQLVKAVETITALPSGPERWRAAIALWLRKNEVIPTPEGPLTAQQYNDLQIRENNRLRDTQINRFGEIKGGGLRMGLSIPAGAWVMVKLCDPAAFNQGHGNTDLVKRNLRRFMRAFPEYVIGVD